MCEYYIGCTNETLRSWSVGSQTEAWGSPQYNCVCSAETMDEICIFWFGNQRDWHQGKEGVLQSVRGLRKYSVFKLRRNRKWERNTLEHMLSSIKLVVLPLVIPVSEVPCDYCNICYYIWICLVSTKCFAEQCFLSSNMIRHLFKEILFKSPGHRDRDWLW